jgi:hypothetical protein
MVVYSKVESNYYQPIKITRLKIKKTGGNIMEGRKFFAACAAVFFVLCFTFVATASEKDPVWNKVAQVSIGSSGIYWQPKVNYDKIVLTVSRPGGQVFQKTFDGAAPYLGLSDMKGQLADGVYTYELRVIPMTGKKVRKAGDEKAPPVKTLTQSGYFSVQGGSILTNNTPEGGPAVPLDILHYDDVIITGSLCVGFDCQNGESFGFDTIILKEHNLRIYFNDTSYTASYPTNNWRITINDSTNGGASYFSVDDVDDGTSIFKIEAGAPSNSLYVEDYGRVGLGTATPVVELHIKDSDTPTLRLEQDSSGGWTAQTWDVAGNESNFFIRDATNGSKLPFRIQPSTPSSTLCLKSDGKVGIGTWSPLGTLEVETTGSNCAILFERTDGATGKFTARANEIYIGTSSNHNVMLVANNNQIMTIEPGGDVGIGLTNPGYKLHIAGGAYCDGGSWVPGSSREYKENIVDLTLSEAVDAFEKLNPVKFNYKTNKDEDYIGFIAEDVPELVATKERKGVAPMDVIAVLTKVVQEQQEVVREQQETILQLNKRVSDLEKKTQVEKK